MNWAEVSSQLEREVTSERRQRQARRRQQPALWQSLRQWWSPAGIPLITRQQYAKGKIQQSILEDLMQRGEG